MSPQQDDKLLDDDTNGSQYRFTDITKHFDAYSLSYIPSPFMPIACRNTIESTAHDDIERYQTALERPGSSYTVSSPPTFDSFHFTIDGEETTRNPWEAASVYPDRPIKRPEIDMSVSLPVLQDWAKSVRLELGPMIPESAYQEALCVFYHYRHLECEDMSDLPYTDLLTHRVNIPASAKPSSNPVQKRWPPHTEQWMRTLVMQGIRGGVYERTESANGRLSPWNVRIVMVDKVENPTPEDEPRMAINYAGVPEILPGSYQELSARVHDHLSDPRHKVLFAADLKHAYLSICIHPEDRHYFAFTVAGPTATGAHAPGLQVSRIFDA